mmetsp:Transcript_39341/g.66060  ORF Transcript_39341/g.66060 Transcript_39341/m.66060 type:complete len:391 (-) Transcript_39341:367-1539(-)
MSLSFGMLGAKAGLCCAVVALILQTASARIGYKKLEWETAFEQTPTHHGDGETSPSVRYSHAAVTWRDEMIVTHGYFYDRANASPSWRDDTWGFSLRAPHTWRKIVPLGGGATGSSPHGRYGHTLALHGSDLYLHGGTDGGTRIHGEAGFQLRMEFDDMWRLSLTDNKWEQLKPKASGHPFGPGKRYLHTAVAVGTNIWHYGGSNKSDLWGWDTEADTWFEVIPKPGEQWPGRRQGHSAAELPERGGFVIQGGTRWGFGDKALLSDVWVFKAQSRVWEQLRTHAPQPAGRLYSSVATMNGRMVLMGGSTNTPGMKCEDEAWVYDTVTSQWDTLPPAPVQIYHHSVVAHAPTQTMFVFGGHRCGADSPGNPAYLNSVYKLTVPPAYREAEL